MIFFQTWSDIFITKLKKSYAFIQDKIEKKVFSKDILYLTELITEQLLHSEFDYSNNSVIFNRELDCQL